MYGCIKKKPYRNRFTYNYSVYFILLWIPAEWICALFDNFTMSYVYLFFFFVQMTRFTQKVKHKYQYSRVYNCTVKRKAFS